MRGTGFNLRSPGGLGGGATLALIKARHRRDPVARLARGSASWLIPPLLVAAALAAFGWQAGLAWPLWLALLPAVVLVFFVNFFRDPDRTPAPGVASPADGKVVRIDTVDDPDVGQADRVAIFMSPLDVHVNRFPLDGKVVSVRHVPGGHIPAFDKDSDRNERVETILDTPLGRVKVVQIAGTVARRIVPYIQAGQPAQKGARMGLIRFGSRCDLYIPIGKARWTVRLGQQLYAAKDQVAEEAA